MKKFCKLIVALFLTLTMAACSSSQSEKKEASLTFFNALHKTMTAQSLKIEGTIDLKSNLTGSGNFTLYLNQKDQLQLALLLDVNAMGMPMKDFFNFYIRDGKTYLNSMGTKSQSLAENIGLEPGEKLESWDPFLSLTDEEKQELFKSASVSNDTYRFTIDPSRLAYYLDSMGTTTLSKADLEATIQNDTVTALNLDLEGRMNMDGKGQSFAARINMKASDINGDVRVPYPDDLDSWNAK